MKRHSGLNMSVLLLGLLVSPLRLAIAVETQPVSKDNTRMNRYDQRVSTLTADHATNDVSDIQLMQRIRKAVQRDDLSTYARNVKIIATNGQVTLTGTVRTSQEKDIIEKEAVRVAGAENVTNDILVQGK